MISSIFGKTKPVNYVILLSFLFLLYWFVHLILVEQAYSLPELVYHGFVLSILMFSIYVVNFIVKRNQVTAAHSYTILFYTILIATFYRVVLDDNVIFCSFFVLLATRRVLSLRSLKDIKQKIFDASLWILVSSLFYDWAVLFLLMVFLAIYSYEPKNIRNWLVPLVAFGAFSLVGLSIVYLLDRTEFITSHYRFEVDPRFNFFAYWINNTKFIIYMVAIVISGILASVNLGKLGQGKLITMRLLAFSLLIGLLITIVNTEDNVYPILLTFFPGAVLLSQYIEVLKREKLRDALLVIAITTPVLILLADFISR